ncbi:hypothetical protein HY224_01410 [Candidatus Uhrbacteria bacterium]|nr:hypothetical protein [Candidatus Uhrbacteria bacterium]
MLKEMLRMTAGAIIAILFAIGVIGLAVGISTCLGGCAGQEARHGDEMIQSDEPVKMPSGDYKRRYSMSQQDLQQQIRSTSIAQDDQQSSNGNRVRKESRVTIPERVIGEPEARNTNTNRDDLATLLQALMLVAVILGFTALFLGVVCAIACVTTRQAMQYRHTPALNQPIGGTAPPSVTPDRRR